MAGIFPNAIASPAFPHFSAAPKIWGRGKKGKG